ncbi:DUF6415 family natural product biosynthesis protein [Streptomyces aureoversilis]|uniref:DUF6415 family natural product biosynthesis protein n=1 Tax=Streptomyces aureoversilis TaxID=67277 RepID=A0ABW0A879_9ACTN
MPVQDAALAPDGPPRSTCRRALAHRPVALPRAQEIHALATRIRGDLKVMLPEAQERADQFLPGTTQWYCWEGLIENARRELAEGPGGGLYSAFTHMQALAWSAELIAPRLEE